MTRAILSPPRNDASHAVKRGSASKIAGLGRRSVTRKDPDIHPGRVLSALIIAFLLCFASASFALDLPESCRVRNIEGRCLWSCLATLGYRHNIRQLQDLAPDRKVLAAPKATDENVRRTLAPTGVVWRGHDQGSFKRDLLPLANTRGCIVAMRSGTPWLNGKSLYWAHAIVLTKYDREGVEFFCPNYPEQIWRRDRAWFDRNWLGNCMVFDAEGE